MPRPPHLPIWLLTPASTSHLTTYPIYFLEHHDPSITLHAYTYALFVQTHHAGTGTVLRIRGDVYTGMTYERSPPNTAPSLHGDFSKVELWATVECWRFADVVEVCAGMPVPGRQRDEPLYRSLEWCEDVMRELKRRGIVNKMG